MNLDPFTGPGSTPSRRRFWDKVTQAVMASQKVSGKNVSVDEHQGYGSLISVNPQRQGGSPTPTGACCSGATCSITTEADCSGAYLGDGTECVDDPNSCCTHFDSWYHPFFNSDDGLYYATADFACGGTPTYSDPVASTVRYRQRDHVFTGCSGYPFGDCTTAGTISVTFRISNTTCLQEQTFCDGTITFSGPPHCSGFDRDCSSPPFGDTAFEQVISFSDPI